MTVAPGLSDIDLTRTSLFAEGDPDAVFRRLRAEAPVHWNPGPPQFPGFWAVTRYEDILAVSRDTATFSSAYGIGMNTDPNNLSPMSGSGKMLITTDPPRHLRLRRLVNRAFTPRMVRQMEPHIREIVTGLLDPVATAGRCDFVLDIAAPLPLAVICETMGVPRQDWDYMFALTNRVLGADDPEYQLAGAGARQTALQGHREMFGYFMRLVAERRRERREDLLSVLVDADVDGEALTEEELLFFGFLLIIAGNETTRNAVSGGMLALIEHPEQRDRLLADPSLIPSGVEEILRYVSPVMHMARIATRDTEIRGQPVRAGEKVLMWYPSANRDEAVFPEPDRFDVGRTPNDHLAFGYGEHFCLGAGLARLEMRVLFEELLRRLPDLALAGPVERLHSTLLRGIKRMPVQFSPLPLGEG
jgi:cytochrome P450